MRVFDNILEHGASSTGFAAILGPASKEKTPCACALVPFPTSSQCFSGNSHRDTQTDTRTRTHAARHSTAQHTCSVAILSSIDGKESAVRARSRGSPSFMTVPIQRHTHTHGQHAHTHRHRANGTHTHRRTNMYRHRHAHAHCDDPFPMRHSSFFQFAPALSSAPLDRRNGLLRRRCHLLTSGAGDLPKEVPWQPRRSARRLLPRHGGSVDMRTSSGICGPNWDWKPRTGRGSRRAGKTSTRVRSSPDPEPTRLGFRGCSEGRSAMCDRRDAQIRKAEVGDR